MSLERLSFKENPYLRGSLYYVGALVIAGISIKLIHEAITLALAN